MVNTNIKGFYEVSEKEKSYYLIRLISSILIYGLLIFIYFAINSGTVLGLMKYVFLIIPLSLFILFFYWVRNGLFIGMIKSFSIKINEKQLPEIYKIVRRISQGLNIKNTPNIYLLQSGGSLNAFAKKYFNSNYVVIYSDLLEAYYEGDQDAVEFVIAHELGHIKRNHFFKELFLVPSLFVPFLALAYYRGCEFTCDNIGKFFNSRGAVKGLLILASGKKLHNHIVLEEYLKQQYTDSDFWRWFAEKFLTHPSLYKRLRNVYDGQVNYKVESKNVLEPSTVEDVEIDNKSEPKEEDHSRYMPG